MRIVFAGTPAFAAVSLEALVAAGFAIPLVLTQPDRPAGRGRKTRPSEVKQAALEHGLRVAQPHTLRGDDARGLLREAFERDGADVMVVAAYGLLLPPAVLALPPAGCVNVHASLLPRWRGAAPIQRAIEAGDRETGVSIMAMDEGLDTGAVYVREAVTIGPRDTAGALHDTLAALGARTLVKVLPDIVAGRLLPEPQPDTGVSYAAKIDKREARIDWRAGAVAIDAQVRAFNPWPTAFTTLPDERRLRVLATSPAAPPTPDPERAGTLADAPDGSGPPRVATGDGWLSLERVQLAGGKPTDGASFRRGARDVTHLV